eukprot:522041_1
MPKRSKKRSGHSDRKNSKNTVGNRPKHTQLIIQNALITQTKKVCAQRLKRQKSSGKTKIKGLKTQNEKLKQNNHEQKNQLSNALDYIEEQYINSIDNYPEPNDGYDSDWEMPNKCTKMDLIILFEMLQTIPYRKIEHTIMLVKNLSSKFKMPSIAWLNQLAQTKKELFNKAHIAYETTLGSFASDTLTFGSDGSNAKCWKFTGGNLLQRNEDEQRFDRIVLFQSKLVGSDSACLQQVINSEFDAINKVKRELFASQIYNQMLVDSENNMDDQSDDNMDGNMNQSD